MQNAIKHNRVTLFNAFFKQLADITAAYVKLALSPAFALIPGLHEGQRLFVVNNSVMRPGCRYALQNRLHGKFHIFRQAGCAPAIAAQNIGGNAHARAAKAA